MQKLLSFLVLFATSLACAGVGTNAIFYREESGHAVLLTNIPQDEGYSVLIAGPAIVDPVAVVVAALSASTGAEPSGNMLRRARRYGDLVDEAARASRVEARLLHAVIAAESAYDPVARSPKGAVGMMQLLPATARRYGVVDSLDARQNIQGGARYLADLLRLFHSDTRLALAAYNAGENAVLRYGSQFPPYAETRAYVPRVLDFYRRFSAAAL